jgi:hypothetical protein
MMMKIKPPVLLRFSPPQLFFLLLLLFAAVLLSSCVGLFGPRDVELPLYKLQASIDKRFPLDKRYLDVFDISFTNPQIRLLPDSGRMQLEVDTSIAPPFTSKRWKGHLGLSGALQLNEDRDAILLVEPRIDQLKLDGLDPAHARQFAKLGGFLVDSLFKGAPLYEFKDGDLRYVGTRFEPSAITVKADALVVRFEPVK